MRLFQYLIFFLAISCFKSIGQSNDCDSIFWTANRKLSWLDFKAKPDTTVNFWAVSRPAMSYKSNLQNDTLKILTSCRFITCKSWTKSHGVNLLKHEQTHFDIAEYCRRLYTQKLLTITFNSQNVMQTIDNIYKEVIKFRSELDAKYDRETNFSRNEMIQDHWTKDITKKIIGLQDFETTSVTIILKQ